MKSLVISKYASVLAVMAVMTIVLMGADSDNGLVFMATKMLAVLTGAIMVKMGIKWAEAGKFGTIEE